MKGLLVKLRYQKRHTSAVTKLLSLCVFFYLCIRQYIRSCFIFIQSSFPSKHYPAQTIIHMTPENLLISYVYCDPLQISMTLYFKLRRQIQDRYSRKNADILHFSAKYTYCFINILYPISGNQKIRLLPASSAGHPSPLRGCIRKNLLFPQVSCRVSAFFVFVLFFLL